MALRGCHARFIRSSAACLLPTRSTVRRAFTGALKMPLALCLFAILHGAQAAELSGGPKHG